jgi:23S rRNA (cytidine1920-2'-O)/16S rRNA (cytidine1409-2'-O)-methyltransferase
MKQRLDQLLVGSRLVPTRSQAVSLIRLGMVFVSGRPVRSPEAFVDGSADIELRASGQYVSRAGLKLASVAAALHLTFTDALVLDVGSSTGGFTDYALQHGARKVIAVDIGTNQLHPSLRTNPKVELHEQTDIRTLPPLAELPDVVVIDVSFVSLRDILPSVARLCGAKTEIIAMVKPQFETRAAHLKHEGVIKNDRMRRDILKDFETWVRQSFVIVGKADSAVAGANGNLERFYRLHRTT